MPMDPSPPSLAAWAFLVISAAAGCGDASAPRIDGPGARASDVAKDAAPDQDPYRDPKAGDAGCVSPNEVCNGVCVVVSADPANCGACGNACLGTDSVCIAGKCGCSGPLVDYCDGVGCMDVSSDFNNCGACGHACDPNNDSACSDGNCVPNN